MAEAAPETAASTTESSEPDEKRASSTTNSRPRQKGLKWRPWLRAAHRDVGYLLVGLTFIYALSGLAVNHIDDWNSNFVDYSRTHQLEGPLPREDAALSQEVRRQLGIAVEPDEVYWVDDEEVEILFDERTLTIDTKSGAVRDEGRNARFFFRLANWLHLNRGKKAWTYIADGYAALLLMLAVSGMFMIKGPKGIKGRGLLLVTAGVAVPVLYVVLSGGP